MDFEILDFSVDFTKALLTHKISDHCTSLSVDSSPALEQEVLLYVIVPPTFYLLAKSFFYQHAHVLIQHSHVETEFYKITM